MIRFLQKLKMLDRLFPRAEVPEPLSCYYMAAYDLDEFDQVHTDPGWYVRWIDLPKTDVVIFGSWEHKVDAEMFMEQIKAKYRGII